MNAPLLLIYWRNFAILYLKIIKLRVGATSNCTKWTLNVITCILVKLFNAFQWNCFNLVYTCNIALILFLKCDFTKFRIPPPLVTRRPPLSPLIYGWPLNCIMNCIQSFIWDWNATEKYAQKITSLERRYFLVNFFFIFFFKYMAIYKVRKILHCKILNIWPYWK